MPANAPSSGQVSIGPSGDSPQARVVSPLGKGPDVLPAEMNLGPFVPLFERTQTGPGVSASSNFASEPLLLENDQVAVLSFGRRVIVTGKTARIIDRAENPRFDEVAIVPESSGGGFIFLANARASYAKTFDGEPMPLRTTNDVDGMQLHFGPRTVLFMDSMSSGGDDEDDGPETYTYVSLVDGRVLPFALNNIQVLSGTLDGRTAALSKDGEIFFAAKPDESFRKVNVPRAQGLSVEGTEISVNDALGQYVLEPSLTRDGMKPPSMNNASSPTMPPQAGSTYALRGRKLDENTIVNVAGTELRTADRLGNDTNQVLNIAPGNKQRYCEFLASEGPMFLTCRGNGGKGGTEMTMAIHLFDPVKKTGKVDKPINVSRERGMVNITTGPTGMPAFFSKCDGQVDGSTACVRTKEGSYREVDFRRGLIATNVIDPNQPRQYSFYHIYSTPLAPGENGNAAVLSMKDEEGILILSDGRTRTFDLKPLPRRARGGFRGNNEGVTWLTGAGVGDKVIGFVDPRGGYRHVPKRSMGGRRIKPPSSQAVAFSVPIQGETTAVQFDGFLGRSAGHVLRISADGHGMEESADLGQTFKPVQAPPGLSLDPKLYEWDSEDFCAETACRIGPWIRTGWGK
jgi:hypothetical protein